VSTPKSKPGYSSATMKAVKIVLDKVNDLAEELKESGLKKGEKKKCEEIMKLCEAAVNQLD